MYDNLADRVLRRVGIGKEGTEVVPEDHISPEDRGHWTNSPLEQIVDFGGDGPMVGIQLAHIGRKASTLATWIKSSADRGHLDCIC